MDKCVQCLEDAYAIVYFNKNINIANKYARGD